MTIIDEMKAVDSLRKMCVQIGGEDGADMWVDRILSEQESEYRRLQSIFRDMAKAMRQ